jgi:CRISPR-associated protein Csb2
MFAISICDNGGSSAGSYLSQSGNISKELRGGISDTLSGISRDCPFRVHKAANSVIGTEKSRGTNPPARPYAAFAFYRPDQNTMRSFPATRAIAVAGMVRCLTGRMARQTGHCDPDADIDQWVNEYVMGHGESDGLRPRFSYMPLPSIRPPNVLGDIRRVMIAEPPGGAGIHTAWASRTLRGQILVSEQQREEALLMALGSGDGVLRQYVAMSDTWASVTPVVLPGSDEGKFAKGEKLFFKALRHAGYCPEAMAELEFRNVSFWPGGELALKFQRPDYLKKGHWSVYHMRVRWRQRMKGPLAIGAGRHCGLGVFAATNT